MAVQKGVIIGLVVAGLVAAAGAGVLLTRKPDPVEPAATTATATPEPPKPADPAPTPAPAPVAATVPDPAPAPQVAPPAADPRLAEMSIGSADARVTIIEYASLTCPHCASFHNTVLPTLRTEYIDTGKVRLVFREVYFDVGGLSATMLARCEPARYFGIVSELFRTQRSWTKFDDAAGLMTNLRQVGKLAFLPEERINACLADEGLKKALVERYQAQMAKDQIEGTPSFIIDGEKVSNRDIDGFRKLLDAKLQ